MAFSGGVKLGDLDDFISAAQDCVKPLIQAAGGDGGSAKLDSSSEGLRSFAPRTGSSPPVTEEVPLVQRPNLIKSKKSASDPKAEIGQVTLSDCLACSGCVTSAETVLLQAQSVDEFIRRVQEAPVTVVTITPEVRASISSRAGCGPLEAFLRLSAALRRLGVSYVLDSSAAEAVALLEGKAEFVQRFRQASQAGAGGTSKSSSALPLLTSHCPGWTCYAEKVVDPVVLPHVSPIRPPQQIQGRLVKSLLLDAHNRRHLFRSWRRRSPLFAAECAWWLKGLRGGVAFTPLAVSDVYHVAVQPCFDRKIEGARPQFEIDSGVREVDTVLTSTELLELVVRAHGGEPATAPEEAAEAGIAALMATPPCSLDDEVVTDVLLGDLRRGRPDGSPLLCNVEANAESGGFAEFVFREAARDLFSKEVGPVSFAAKQNEDIREVVLKDERGRELLKFVSAYGFRNIQNIIRRVVKASGGGPNDCGQFVEIMACPGGCVNGGGQVPAAKGTPPPPPGSAPELVREHAAVAKGERRRRLDALEAAMRSGPGVAMVRPEQHPLTLHIYREVVRRASAGSIASEGAALDSLVGGAVVRSWLGAEWRSLKVNDDGEAIVGTAALKW